MTDFEASVEPLQDCLNATEMTVQESSTKLYDLTAKKMELHKLQVLSSMVHQAQNLTECVCVQKTQHPLHEKIEYF